MDLGFIVPPKIISGDDLLVQAAQEMRKLGLSLAGVVQHNPLAKGPTAVRWFWKFCAPTISY